MRRCRFSGSKITYLYASTWIRVSSRRTADLKSMLNLGFTCARISVGFLKDIKPSRASHYPRTNTFTYLVHGAMELSFGGMGDWLIGLLLAIGHIEVAVYSVLHNPDKYACNVTKLVLPKVTDKATKSVYEMRSRLIRLGQRCSHDVGRWL